MAEVLVEETFCFENSVLERWEMLGERRKQCLAPAACQLEKPGKAPRHDCGNPLEARERCRTQRLWTR